MQKIHNLTLHFSTRNAILKFGEELLIFHVKRKYYLIFVSCEKCFWPQGKNIPFPLKVTWLVSEMLAPPISTTTFCLKPVLLYFTKETRWKIIIVFSVLEKKFN